MRYKAVLFDADGVIQVTGADWHQRFAHILSEPDQVESFLDDIFAAESPCLTSDANFTSELAKVLYDWEVEESVESVLKIWEDLDTIESVLDVVRDLRKDGLQCHLASNQQAYRAEYMRYQLDYNSVFDQQFYSCDLVARKPDQEFFIEVMLRLDLPATQILYIDDSHENVIAAQQMDIDAVEFRSLDYARPGIALRQILAPYLAAT